MNHIFNSPCRHQLVFSSKSNLGIRRNIEKNVQGTDRCENNNLLRHQFVSSNTKAKALETSLKKYVTAALVVTQNFQT